METIYDEDSRHISVVFKLCVHTKPRSVMFMNKLRWEYCPSDQTGRQSLQIENLEKYASQKLDCSKKHLTGSEVPTCRTQNEFKTPLDKINGSLIICVSRFDVKILLSKNLQSLQKFDFRYLKASTNGKIWLAWKHRWYLKLTPLLKPLLYPLRNRLMFPN